MVVINLIYDGLCYNVEKIVVEIGSVVDFLYFDEVWYVYVVFYLFYENYYGMVKGKLCE